MKALCWHGKSDIRCDTVPDPEMRSPRDAIIKVTACAICGSDLHWFSEAGIGDAQLERPLVLGHEFAGETEDGWRVAVDPAISCRQCEFCLKGNPNLCSSLIFAGHGETDGGLQECIAWDVKSLYAIPDSFTYADGAMLEPLGVAIHAIDLGKLRAGMTVAVFGCGPIGLLIVQLARLVGANKEYIERQIPHLSSLLCEDIEDVTGHSEVIVVGTQSAEFADAVNQLVHTRMQSGTAGV